MGGKGRFDDWVKQDDGMVGLTPVVGTEAQAIPERHGVAFRLAMIAGEKHLVAIDAGESRPVVLQLSFDATDARRFASQLELAADLAEGRTPRPKD
jgi:hypothetical protein